MAVVSASKYAEAQIDKTKLNHYFEFIISGTSELNIRNKPYPDIYEHAIKIFNIQPQEALSIEDSLNGVRAALGSGAGVIGINRGYLVVDENPNLTIVESLYDIEM